MPRRRTEPLMNRDEQVSKNLELAGRYLDHLLEHPAELAEQPDRQTVVLLPEDDEALAEANMQLARRLIRQCPNCGAASRSKEHPFEGAADAETGEVLLHTVCP